MAPTAGLSLPLFPIAFAGVVAIGATVAIERFGGRLGGVLGTLPTTIVPASVGFAAVASHAALADSLATVPVGMVLNAGFLYLWRVVPPHLPDTSLPVRLGLMTVVSLVGWLLGALCVVYSEDALASVGVSVAWQGSTAAVVLVVLGLLACRNLPPAPRGRRRVGVATLVARGLLSAGAIGAALGLSQVAGPMAAGLASVFPAIFLTAMASLWLSQGEAVPLGAVGPMILGSSAVVVYALVAAVSIPALGTAPGAALAWVIAVMGISVPAAALLARKRDDAAPTVPPTPAP